MKQIPPTPKIGLLRERAGLTQRELAQIVGVTETTIANWERGRSGLDWIERFIKLCNALNCDLDDLIEYSTGDQGREPSFEELRQMYRTGQLSHRQIESNTQS
ncbi:MAG TPA: helix-turn-helix transcriptional regulator [Crinalium sp.]|jgi:transcriptional regulator with XRE-family HTH domain